MTVTQGMVDEYIVKEEDFKAGKKTTVVVLTLANGFEVVGTSACVDEYIYDHSIGVKYATEDAKRKVWQLLAFRMQSEIFHS